MKSASRSGFTLLELLVAVAIAALLSTASIVAASRALVIWRFQQSAQSRSIVARQVFDHIERDFQALLWRDDTDRCFAIDLLSTASSLANHGWLFPIGVGKPPGVPSMQPLPPPDPGGLVDMRKARFGLAGAWLRFVATNVESGGGLPAVISYQVVRRPVTGPPVATNPAPVRYALYRSVVSTSATFATGYDVTVAGYASSTETPSSAESANYRVPRNVMNPSHANLLASNVVDFGCWGYRRDASGTLIRIFPADPLDAQHHARGDSATDESRIPDVVDVALRLLDDAGAAQLAAMEAGKVARPAVFATDAAWWWSVVEASSEVFVRRILVRQSPHEG